MKFTVVLAVSLLAFTVVTTNFQAQDLNGREAFQVKKNVLIKDAAGAKLADQRVEDVKIWEDDTEQAITALSANSSPLYLEIILDDSGSMAKQRANMIAIAKFIIESLEADSQIQIVRFGGLKRVRVANEWTADKPLLLKALDEDPIQAGSSPTLDAAWTALDQIKTAKALPGDKRFAIVLISDCMEGGSMHRPNELLAELTKVDVPLFTVSLLEPSAWQGFSNIRFEQILQSVEKFPHDSALASGGSVYFPRKGENASLPISESLKGLATELQSQFVLIYTPTNQARDGKERKLRIEVAETYDGKHTAAIKETHVVILSK
jgi:Ca-activated chloride channel homolog